MGLDSKAYAKAIRECDIMPRRQREEAERNMLGALYSFASELGGKNDSAAEREAETRLDEAVGNGKEAGKIMDLATDWYSEGREAGFRMGFHMATKILTEGLNGGAVL